MADGSGDEEEPQLERVVGSVADSRPWLLVDGRCETLVLRAELRDRDYGGYAILPITGDPDQEVVVCGPSGAA
eukprot:8693610-Lingulodinium_polyedra.AAC.1